MDGDMDLSIVELTLVLQIETLAAKDRIVINAQVDNGGGDAFRL